MTARPSSSLAQGREARHRRAVEGLAPLLVDALDEERGELVAGGLIPHHVTFSTTIQLSYISTKG
jgi:hypothetical protein